MVVHRPGAPKGGVGASIGNEVRQHPIATAGVAILAGIAIWALVSGKEGQDSTTTPSDSFWQGYSTAQEDFLQMAYSSGYGSVAHATTGTTQTPGSVTSSSPATGFNDSTNSVFTPAYTTDITPSGMPSGANPMLPVRTGTKLPAHLTKPKGPTTTHPRTGHPAAAPAPAKPPTKAPATVRTGHVAGRGPVKPGGSGGGGPIRGIHRSGIEPGTPPPYQPITPLGL